MSSPSYRPGSPDLSFEEALLNYYNPSYTASFERYEDPMNFEDSYDELEDDFEEYEALMNNRLQFKIRENDDWKKRKAECEFKIQASRGYYVEEFFEANLFADNIPIEANMLESQHEMYSPIVYNKPVEDYENYQLISLFSASYEDVNNDYKTENLKFNDPIIDEFKKGFENDQLDLKIKRDSVDTKLFIERNLFQALQYHSKIDNNYIKNHFPMKDEFDKINVKHFHSVDNLLHIQNRVQEIAERNVQFKNLFLKDKSFNRFKNLILQDKYVDRFACLMYLLFIKPEYIRKYLDRSLVSLDPKIFSSSRYKFFLVSDIFKSVNIFFFEDFCNFRIYKRFIANSLLSNFRNYVEIKKKNSSKKRKIQFYQDENDDEIRHQVMNDVRIHLMDRTYYPDQPDDIEEDNTLKRNFSNVEREYDYSHLKEGEIRHDIIKY